MTLSLSSAYFVTRVPVVSSSAQVGSFTQPIWVLGLRHSGSLLFRHPAPSGTSLDQFGRSDFVTWGHRCFVTGSRWRLHSINLGARISSLGATVVSSPDPGGGLAAHPNCVASTADTNGGEGCLSENSRLECAAPGSTRCQL